MGFTGCFNWFIVKNFILKGGSKMAKSLLWLGFILAFVAIGVEVHNGEHVQLFTKILFWSFLGILSICESIEKINKR